MPFTSSEMPPPQRLWVLAGVATLLAVLMAVLVASYQEDDVAAVPGADAASAAKAALNRLFSFDDGGLREELRKETDLLTDDYRQAYADKFIDLTGTAVLDAGVSVEAKVELVGVVEQDGDTARVLAYVVIASSLPDGEESEPSGRPVSVELQDVGGEWLVSDVQLL